MEGGKIIGETYFIRKGKGIAESQQPGFVAATVNLQRISWNETFVRQSLEDAYGQIFGGREGIQ